MNEAALGRGAAPGGTHGRPMRTIFFGSGAFAVPVLDALVTMPGTELVAIVSAPDRPAGRSGMASAVPVAIRARELGLPLIQPTRLRSDAAVADVGALQPELGVLADYGQIVPPSILALPKHGILNVHPSILPRHRGASPIPATILGGDDETGVTIIAMDAGLDTGPVVAVSRWPLTGSERAPELELQAAMEGADLLRRTIPGWLANEVIARPQAVEGATLTRPLRRDDGRLDPRRPAAELARQVRAYEPWPGAFVDTDGGRLKVLEAQALPGDVDSSDTIGTLAGDREVRLVTGDGHLLLVRVQPAGGRPMTGEELLRGRPALAGTLVR